MDEFDQYYEAVEPGRRERAYAWATAIGLQDVDGLKPSEYLHKADVTVSVVENVTVNDRVNLSEIEEKAVIVLLREPKSSAILLGKALEVSERQARRIIASLKKKAGLKRRGSDKKGEWYFEKS